MRCPGCGSTLTGGFCYKCGYNDTFTPEEWDEYREGLMTFSFGSDGIEVDEDNTGSDNIDFAQLLAGKMNLFRDGLNGDESIDDVSDGFAQMMSNASREYNEDKGRHTTENH